MTDFDLRDELRPLEGLLIYRIADHAFDFMPRSSDEVRSRAGTQGISSIAIGTLQLEVGVETGNVLFPWGYHANASWTAASHRPVPTMHGGLRALARAPFDIGVAQAGVTSEQWITTHDTLSGWVRLGAPGKREDAGQLIEFATDSLARIVNRRLTELYLRPQFIKS